jgi:hypothetical protein
MTTAMSPCATGGRDPPSVAMSLARGVHPGSFGDPVTGFGRDPRPCTHRHRRADGAHAPTGGAFGLHAAKADGLSLALCTGKRIAVGDPTDSLTRLGAGPVGGLLRNASGPEANLGPVADAGLNPSA